MFNFLRRKPKIETPVMADEDKAIIFRLAAGDNTCRDEAIEIHRRYIPIIGSYGHGSLEQDFMSEVDNPCPDYLLRNHYRTHLLARNSQ